MQIKETKILLDDFLLFLSIFCKKQKQVHISNIFHERLELITDSAGAGKYRGGLGIRRDISFVADSEIISMKKKTKTGGWGLNGGRADSKNKMIIWPETNKEKSVGMYRTFMKEGESFQNYSAGV